MKCICFMLFVIVAHGFVLRPGQKRSELPAPTMAGYSLLAKWNKVINPEDNDPVLGYIVTVSELLDPTDSKDENMKSDDDVRMSVNVEAIKVEGADHTQLFIEDLNHKANYDIRVQAYTKIKRGPMSNATVVSFIA